RQPLWADGEVVWHVAPFSSPEPAQPLAYDLLAESDAVRLFVDRAIAAHRGFRLTTQNASSVSRLCQRLDGLPLAIELAAARAAVLPVDQIEAHLSDRFRLLASQSPSTDPRHQSLRTLLDWSYELLSDDERILLRRLAVFRGGWTLSAAELVCA